MMTTALLFSTPEVRPVPAVDVDESALLCAGPACRRLPVRGRLCRHHGDQIGQWLAEVGADWRGLLDDLARGEDGRLRPGGDAASSRRATTVKSRTSPVNLDALSLSDRRIAWLTDEDLEDLVDDDGRDSTPRVLEVLAWWAAQVRDGRGLTWPTRSLPLYDAGPVCAGRCFHLSCAAARDGVRVAAPAPLTVEGERRVLVDHLDWCLGQEWAGPLWRSIRQLWGALKAARGEDVGRPVAVCRRPADPTLPVAGGSCGGAVWSERGAGWCGRCGYTWTGGELLELTRKGVAA